MKHLAQLLFLLLMITTECPSQAGSSNVVNISRVGADGILLNKGWKFHAGDNAEWSRPALNDSGWKNIDPSTDIHYLPEFKINSIGWFRIHLHIDSALFNQTLSLLITQVGASEIYLNGHLLYSLGRPDANGNEKTLFMQRHPFSLKLDQGSYQTLAVRYSFNRNNFYFNYLPYNYCFRVVIEEANKGFFDYFNRQKLIIFQNLFQISFYLLLGLMCLFLYRSFRIQPAYLYIGIFCIAAFAQTLLRIIDINTAKTTSFIYGALFLSHIAGVASLLVLLKGIYTLYKPATKHISRFISVYALATIPVLLYFYAFSRIVVFLFFLLCYADALRVVSIAARKNIAGAKLLFSTFFIIVLLFSIFIIVAISGNSTVGNGFATLAFLVLPVGLSFFVAGEYARTGHSLLAKLKEVEQLSRKSLLQEQEKQQILASQNETLEKEVAQRTDELRQSLENLKATQRQLIQAEKMASLGELTAGIAHEIQNPLNFVNNFSEVSADLVGELKTEKSKAKNERDDQLEADILDDLYINLQKILKHGKRADAIVKGMLEHSRSGAGTAQPTDINVLANEYLKVVYQGFIAKEKSFNVAIETKFDRSITKLDIVPQDIGRVLLNLYANAFDAVKARQTVANGNAEYLPEVTVETRIVSLNGLSNNGSASVHISVKDNGIGIPPKNVDKIFQPFFTTKPTGQGTGLGLSLSYDIVNAHGGEIKVESKEGEGSEFVIILPYQSTV
jgi:signal transduction histidine kinase